MIRKSEPEFAIAPFDFFPFSDPKMKAFFPFLFLLFLQADLKPSLKKLFCTLHDLVRIHFPGKLKLIEQLGIIAVKPRIPAKHAAVMSVTHSVAKRQIMDLPHAGQEAFCIALAKRLKNRAILPFPFKDGIFKPEPEKRLIYVCVFVVLKGAKQRLDARIIIVPTDCAYHSVPIQIGVSILVICLEIRRKSMALRRIPDHVFCPSSLELADFVHFKENRSSAESFPEIRAERISEMI